jgi:hypothetical protein
MTYDLLTRAIEKLVAAIRHVNDSKTYNYRFSAIACEC